MTKLEVHGQNKTRDTGDYKTQKENARSGVATKLAFFDMHTASSQT